MPGRLLILYFNYMPGKLIVIILAMSKFVKNNLIILLIILTGAYLRLWRISEYMTFLGDEGRDVLVVKRMIVEHDITFLGPTASVGGFFLGPIYYYFMTPFLWLWRLDPAGPAVMVALFGIATIYLVFKVGKEFFSELAGIIAAALYALSPLVIAQSRSSWNPNIVPFFSILYIYALWKSSQTNKLIWYLIAGLSIGIGLQLHYLFIFLIPIGLVYLLIYKWRISIWKYYTTLLGGAVLGIFPFLAFEVKNRFPNTQTIIRFILQEEDVRFSFNKAVEILGDVAFRLYGRLVFFFPPPEQLYRYTETQLFLWKAAVIITILVTLSLLTWEARKHRPKTHILIILWTIFGIGLFAFYRKNIYEYYFGIVFTLPFLLTGNLIAWLLGKNRLLQATTIAGLIGLLALNWYGRPFKHPPNRQLEQVKKISNAVFAEAAGKPFNFALITGNNSDHAYRYFMEIWGNSPVTIENFENDPQRLTVTNQLFVVCESLPCKPLGHSLWEIAGFGQAEIVGEWDVSVVKLYKLAHYKTEDI